MFGKLGFCSLALLFALTSPGNHARGDQGATKKPVKDGGKEVAPELALEKAVPLAGEEGEEFLTMSPAKWEKQLALWKRDLKIEPQKEEQAASEAARRNILAIRDPYALVSLEKILLVDTEYPLIQAVFLEPLANISGKGAVRVLAKVAVEQRSKLLYERAAAILVERGDAALAIPTLLPYLKGKKHREAALLALMNSEITKPTGGALPDKQLFRMLVAILKRNDDGINNEAGFRVYGLRGSYNGVGFTGKDLEINRAQIDALKAELDKLEPDPNVHKVLTTYTGQDLGYDQLYWLDWYEGIAKVAKEHKDDLPAGSATKGDEEKLDVAAVAKWGQQIAAWSKEFKLAPKAEEAAASEAARAKIAAVADRAAIPALKKALNAEKYVLAQIVYVEPIARSGGSEALNYLVKLSVEPASDALREAAATAIAQMPNAADAVPQYIRYLRTPQYSVYAARALSFNGLTKYRSGKAPDPQLFQALVNSLVLPDTYYVPIAHWFDSGPVYTIGGGVIRTWGTQEGVAKIVRRKPNPIAEARLKEYTGQSYGYDQEAWNRWFQKETKDLKKK